MAFVVPVAALAIEFMVSERTIYDHREPQKARKIMTAKAKTMKPRKPATGQVRDAMHKKQAREASIALQWPHHIAGRCWMRVERGLRESDGFRRFRTKLAQACRRRDYEIGDVIRIAEMNVAAMASLAEMQAKLEERRADQAHDITPPAKRLDANGNVIEMNGHDRIRSRLDGLTGTDRLLALIK